MTLICIIRCKNDKDMKKRNEIIGIVCLGMLLSPFSSSASVDDVEVMMQGDIVSSYVWRGMYQTGVSIQPTLGVGYQGLSLTAWGSTDFDGTSSSAGRAAKEFDLTLAYTFGFGLSINVTDYWWAGQGAGRYFHYGSGTDHRWEAGVSYQLPFKKFPLSMAWYTMFAGADKNSDGGQAYSSYFQLTYPFSIKRFDFDVNVGMSPYKSQAIYGCDSFAVTDVSLKATYTVKACDALSIPLFSQVIFNPRASDAHIVFGVSLVPQF